MSFTSHEFAPELFRRWCAIAMVAGALERRVWTLNSGKKTFPNLYTLLVAPPGVGKFTIELVRGLWRETTQPNSKAPAFSVAPDSVTRESMLDEMVKAKKLLTKVLR